jgi:hypothetical protein
VDDLVNDLRVAFDCLRANGVKMNPEKCVFGVPRGMLLGYIISQRGIEPNPEKVTTLEWMGPIRDLKGVQKVLGYLLTVKIRQPSHGFTFGVGMSFIPYPLVLTPVV